MEERRRHERQSVAVTVDVRYQGETMVCFAADLSESGVRLADLSGVESGDQIDLIFHPTEDETIEITGVVRWVSDTDEGQYSGVEFKELADSAKKRLEQILDAGQLLASD